MLKIGLTGGIGCGKSTVAKYFAELGITVIDADAISRLLTVPGSEVHNKIVDKFGTEVLKPNGELDRRYLRDQIFQNADAKQWLESLLHPIILQEILVQADAAKSPYCVLVIPLLLECDLQDIVDLVLVVDAPEDMQIQRGMERDKVTQTEIEAIMATQVSRKQRLAAADDVIVNNGSASELKAHVNKLHEKYSKYGKLTS